MVFLYIRHIRLTYSLQGHRHYYFCIAAIKLLKLSRQVSDHINLFVTKMPSLIRKQKVSCEHCGSQVTRNNNVRHKKRCSAGTLFCTHCSNSSTISQVDLNYHVAKKHSVLRSSKAYKCKLCHAEIPDFHA